MPLDTLLAIAGIIAATSWTPGPNNAMLAASGASFGFRPTVPHVFGVSLGFGLMLFLVSLGLGEVFELLPWLTDVLRAVGILLLVWIAWRIAGIRAAASGGARGKPFTFLQAAAFQWVNPKAWTMCISVAAQFAGSASLAASGLTAGVVAAAIGTTSAAGWAAFGAMLQGVLARPAYLRAFNLTMALTILLGALYLAGDLLRL